MYVILMLKLLKLTLPLLLVLSNNIEIADCRITNNYKSQEVNANKPSVELRNPSINLNNTKQTTKKELEEFWNCIDGNKFFKNIALQLSESLLNNHFHNIKKFNYKYIEELEQKGSNINTWSYFDAMYNGLQEIINSLNLKSDNYKEKLTMKSLFNTNNYSTDLLNKASYQYLYKYCNAKYMNNNNKTINDIWKNFDALGFDKIFNTIVKGTLKVKNLLQPVEKDKKPLQLNNKELSDNYEKDLNNNNAYLFKLENHDIGICWLDTSFEIIYNSILNTNYKDITNTNFYKFIKFLEQKQKARAQEVKTKNGKEVISKTKKTTNGTMTYYHTTYITDQISILEAFDEFEKQMKKEELESWNNNDNVKKAKEELHNLIEKHNESKKKKMADIQKALQDGLDGKTITNSNETQQPNSNGNNTINGINLFINLFPELKNILVPQYNIVDTNDNKKTDNNNNNNVNENITCGSLYENEIKSFDNFIGITNYGISKSIQYKLLYSTNKKVITGEYDTLTTSNTKYITSLPEYMILNGYHYDNNKSCGIQGMKFDETLNNYIVGFNNKNELAIYEISSMAMNKNGVAHAYALYKDNNGWYIMDDHNKYYRLKPEEFKEIIEKDKVETFVYKKLYCNNIDAEDDKKQENNNNQQNKTNNNIVKENNTKKLPN